MWIVAVLLGFIIPVIYVVYRETRGSKAKDNEPALRKKKEPFSIKAFARVTPVLLFLAVPVYFLS
ncbi:MAG: hypothetical protein Q8P48_07505 [Deltaproteobacteria bacterium]|nr:hypothetical protein [Deltaproteobacteria bacterium]